MFCIIRKNGMYYHNKGRIILFEGSNDAKEFIELFIQYSVSMLIKRDHIEAMNAPMIIMNDAKIIPVDFDIDKVECGVVFASELFNK